MACKRAYRWGLTLMMLTAFGWTSITSRPAAAQSGCSTFEATGIKVCFDFLDYWTAHGGLAQQGYPITTQIQEISPTDGKVYTVQYFERAVFELHSENEPPDNILLSLLGTFAYKAKYPDGAPSQQPNTSEGSQLFSDTGKRVGGKFLDYWQQHGGLAQQGYPISDEFMEKSALDGKEYRVQYFERAVFELHPENQPPYDVLLSQLGTLRKQERAGETVDFTTEDGVKLSGSLYGSGKTAVVLSAICSKDGKDDWIDLALKLKNQGYTVLSYYYRGFGLSEGTFTVTDLELDIAAAVQYVQSRGADKLVLVGGSCGGTISAIQATKTKAEALVILASGQNIEGMGTSDEQLQTLDIPKLFLSAQDEPGASEIQAFYDKMPEPKEQHLYPGTVHATGLFLTEYGSDFTQRILDFIEKNAHE